MWWAESPDVPNWTAGAPSEESLLQLIEEASDFVPFKPYVKVYGFMPTRVDVGQGQTFD